MLEWGIGAFMIAGFPDARQTHDAGVNQVVSDVQSPPSREVRQGQFATISELFLNLFGCTSV